MLGRKVQVVLYNKDEIKQKKVKKKRKRLKNYLMEIKENKRKYHERKNEI